MVTEFDKIAVRLDTLRVDLFEMAKDPPKDERAISLVLEGLGHRIGDIQGHVLSAIEDNSSGATLPDYSS